MITERAEFGFGTQNLDSYWKIITIIETKEVFFRVTVFYVEVLLDNIFIFIEFDFVDGF